MRTISVREAAAALGITPRAVTYRLDKGQLKGTLSKNEFGVPEWRVYPNKEILNAITEANNAATAGDVQIDFQPGDVVDAESVDGEAAPDDTEPAAQRANIEGFQALVEQCVRPLVDEVKAQAVALAEKDRIIEEQARQLRLLPDYQRRAEEEMKRAEEERKAAELRTMEVEALNKQIAAIQEEKQQLEAQVNEATELAADLQMLKTKVDDLQRPWWKKLFQPGLAQ